MTPMLAVHEGGRRGTAPVAPGQWEVLLKLMASLAPAEGIEAIDSMAEQIVRALPPALDVSWAVLTLRLPARAERPQQRRAYVSDGAKVHRDPTGIGIALPPDSGASDGPAVEAPQVHHMRGRTLAMVRLRDIRSGTVARLVLVREGPPPAELESLVAVLGGMAVQQLSNAILIADLTEREAEARAAASQANAHAAARTRFIATMSHELRTPLNAVIGFSEMIRDEAMGPHAEPAYRDYAGDIVDSARHLLDIVNGIIDLAAIESGTLRLNLDFVDLGRVARGEIRKLGDSVANAGLVLTLREEPNMPPVHADEARVRQMVEELLSNALKFTPSGGAVTVETRMEDGLAVIAVSDTGCGIEVGQIAAVLAPFGRLDDAYDRATNGAGLGLSTVKRLIDIHRGRMEIESAPGQGTTVRIYLPAAM